MISNGLPEELAGYIEKEVDGAGLRLVDVLMHAGRGFRMDITLDRDKGGISLDECSAFNRKVSAWVEEKGLFPSGFTVDVSSPGLDRVLKSDMEFSWAVGKEVEVRKRMPRPGEDRITGTLISGNMSEGVVLKGEDGNTAIIGSEDLLKIRLKARTNARKRTQKDAAGIEKHGDNDER